MGHAWREMAPTAEIEEHDFLGATAIKLRDRVSKIQLGEFTVEELGPIMRLFSLDCRTGCGGLYKSDIKIITAALDRINKYRYTNV